MSNACAYDCQYCINRASSDVPRATFTPEELAELTIQFYRRNYIEGLFLSSGVVGDPDYTTERMIRALRMLRYHHGFNGYIHAKVVPGTSGDLVRQMGEVADRLSVNIELPSEASLRRLAPSKTKKDILIPMGQIRDGFRENRRDLVLYKKSPVFAPAGQGTQLIIGATPETDFHILTLASSLYSHFDMKRVYYSAYIPVADHSLLPALDTKPPLLREHRLYQADFLMRQYHFDADEILSEEEPNFNPFLDPKCNWAINHMQFFPVDVNRASREDLLRVPGIGPLSAGRIIQARRTGHLGMAELKKIGVVLKRAQYFILTADFPAGLKLEKDTALRALIDPGVYAFGREQLSLFGLPEAAGSPAPADWAVPADTAADPVMKQPANRGLLYAGAEGQPDGGFAEPEKIFANQEETWQAERGYEAALALEQTSVDEGVEEAILSMVRRL